MAFPSLQSRILSLLLRRAVKTRSLRFYEVAFVRSAVELSLWLHLPYFDTRIRPVWEPRVRGEWIIPPRASSRAALLYFHGGGYFFCSPRTHRPLTMALARMSRLPVFAARYRLAPEHPFPAALDDALAAYRWLLDRGTDLVIGGDSAGGGLAVATMMAAREEGLPLPAACVLFSPWTDLAATGASLDLNDPHCVMFHGDSIRRAAQLYLAGADPRHPMASPLYGEFHDLPPTLIHVSDTEVLLDDSTRLFERGRASGMPVDLKLWSRQPHAWQLWAPVVPEGRASLREAGEFLRTRLGLP